MAPQEGRSQGERVAVLEQQMEDLAVRYERDMTEVKNDLKAILSKFNQMTGGQKAWFGLATILGIIVGVIGSAITIITMLGKTPHP